MAKRNKMLRKILVTMCSAVLLVGATVGVTVAYLTSNTEVVENTFSVGSVNITLDEAPVDVYGDVVEGARTKTNTYKLIPSHNYAKDPTVHVTAGSEPSYLFVKVVNGITEIEAEENTIAAQMAANDWLPVDGANNVYYYNGIVDARTAAVDKIVFEEFTLADGAAVADYATASITIDAYAIQADGFDDAADAWASAPTTWEE